MPRPIASDRLLDVHTFPESTVLSILDTTLENAPNHRRTNTEPLPHIGMSHVTRDFRTCVEVVYVFLSTARLFSHVVQLVHVFSFGLSILLLRGTMFVRAALFVHLN